MNSMEFKSKLSWVGQQTYFGKALAAKIKKFYSFGEVLMLIYDDIQDGRLQVEWKPCLGGFIPYFWKVISGLQVDILLRSYFCSWNLRRGAEISLPHSLVEVFSFNPIRGVWEPSLKNVSFLTARQGQSRNCLERTPWRNQRRNDFFHSWINKLTVSWIPT